jgi:hypothetical protein
VAASHSPQPLLAEMRKSLTNFVVFGEGSSESWCDRNSANASFSRCDDSDGKNGKNETQSACNLLHLNAKDLLFMFIEQRTQHIHI